MASNAQAHGSPFTDDKKLLWKGGGIWPFKASYGKLMMWVFLLSDAFTFTGLLISYGMVRYTFPGFAGATEGMADAAWLASDTYWPVPEHVFTHIPFFHGNFPLVFVGLMTFILIMSSVTMVLAVEAGKRMDKKAVQKWMLWTILGGVLFLSCQAWEWFIFINGSETGRAIIGADGVATGEVVHGANLKVNEYGPQAFADFFFFITGFHGTHVLSGVVLNVILFYNVVMGMYEKRGHYEMVEKVGLYWHFVDLVWVFVFTFFYLI